MIYVNARFVTQPLTGVQRYAFEICMQLKKMDTHIVFLCPPFVKQQDWALDLPGAKNRNQSRASLGANRFANVFIIEKKSPPFFTL